MAITTAVCTSAKKKLLDDAGFDNGGDTFNLALYTSDATLDATTTAYTASNEASGTGYTAGGAALTGQATATSGTTAYVDFADLTFANSSITARGCLIYNATDSNAAIQVHNFGADVTSANGDFTITFPNANATDAIIRLA